MNSNSFSTWLDNNKFGMIHCTCIIKKSRGYRLEITNYDLSYDVSVIQYIASCHK